MNDGCVVIIEPYCWGFEHSPFNAALVATIRIAFPNRLIVFAAELGHLKYVQQSLQNNGVNINNCTFEEINICRRNVSAFFRVVNEVTKSYLVHGLNKKHKPELIVISSNDNLGIIQLKLTAMLRRYNIPIYVFLHSALASLGNVSKWRFWNMKNAIGFLPSTTLKFVALGKTILNEVDKVVLNDTACWVSIDHPYLWPKISVSNSRTDLSNTITFGFFGSANLSKGFDKFCQIADKFGVRYQHIEFILAGFYWGLNSNTKTSNYVQGVSGTPLSSDEFQERASRITYSVWLADPAHYRLTASATFLDSLAYAIPGIYLRNPFIEYYFEQMGDIGYLCDSMDEVYSLMEQLISDFPSSRYHMQVANILATRNIFSPEVLAHTIRKWLPT